eukprot:scaffold25353_cov112-Isochrysis_galbana.AAC.1
MEKTADATLAQKGHWQVPETGHGQHRRSFQDLRQSIKSSCRLRRRRRCLLHPASGAPDVENLCSRGRNSPSQPYADWLCPLHADSRPIQSLGGFLRPTATQTFPSSQSVEARTSQSQLGLLSILYAATRTVADTTHAAADIPRGVGGLGGSGGSGDTGGVGGGSEI